VCERVCVCVCVCVWCVHVCIVDVGINSMPDSFKTRSYWLVGDVDFEVP